MERLLQYIETFLEYSEEQRGMIITRQLYRNSKPVGSLYGCITKSGHLHTSIKIPGEQYYHHYGNHTLVWLWFNGDCPKEIDHKDGNPLNNLLENLRDGSNGINARNQSIRTNNTTGVGGVSIFQGKFKFRIMYNGNSHCKTFATLAEAAAYKEQWLQEHTHLGFTLRHGK